VSYNQLSRGLEEQATLSVLDEVSQVINRLASDLIFMTSDVNGWVKMDDDQVSGSSIMPQKRNPDAWELIRAESHRIGGALAELRQLTTNLSSGYHRDLQRVKHVFMNAVSTADSLLDVVIFAIQGVHFHKENCSKAMKPEVFATHVANQLTKSGVPFRDAYRQASELYKSVSFSVDELRESYLYKGTPGNANTEQLQKMLKTYSEDVSRRKEFFLGAIRKLTS
jgi:argininosuccinate lyase